MNLPFLSVVYCEDVRPEAGNKISFLGVYSGALLVASVPAVLRKLCLNVELRFEPTAAPRDIRFEWGLNGRQIGNVEMKGESVPADLLRADLARAADLGIKRPYGSIGVTIEMPNLKVDRPGVLEVAAVVDGVRIDGPSLRIDLLSAMPRPVQGQSAAEPAAAS